MKIKLDVLLALKAFHVGAAAAASPHRSSALSMLHCAIDQLSKRSDTNSRLWLAFFLATRSELLRGSPESHSDRATVRDISAYIGSPFFDLFMKVEDLTEPRTREVRYNGSTSPYGPVGGSEPSPDNPRTSPIVRMIKSLRNLGIEERDLSIHDRKFLEHTTLLEMLEKQGIHYEH